MIHLHHGQRPRGRREGPRHWGKVLTGSLCAFAPPHRVFRGQHLHPTADRIARRRAEMRVGASAAYFVDHTLHRALLRGQIDLLDSRGDERLKVCRQTAFPFAP